MPELPEVRTVVKFLKAYENKQITNLEIRYPLMSDDLKKNLIGQTIKEVNAKGKYIIFTLSKGFLISHLRMEGKYLAHPEITKHDHIIFHFGNEILKYNDVRKFGTFDYVKADPFNSPPLNKLGEEPFEAKLEDVYELIKASSRNIKTLLLDQSILAGIGNIYANEILFYSKISPFKRGNQLSKDNVKEIIEQSIIVLNEAIKLGGTTIRSFSSGGEVGYFTQNLLVHDQAGKPCKVCGTIIKKEKLQGRMVYYCEKCQK